LRVAKKDRRLFRFEGGSWFESLVGVTPAVTFAEGALAVTLDCCAFVMIADGCCEKDYLWLRTLGGHFATVSWLGRILFPIYVDVTHVLALDVAETVNTVGLVTHLTVD